MTYCEVISWVRAVWSLELPLAKRLVDVYRKQIDLNPEEWGIRELKRLALVVSRILEGKYYIYEDSYFVTCEHLDVKAL